MGDVTEEASPAMVMNTVSANIETSSEQTLIAENIIRQELRLCSTCEADFYKHHSFKAVLEGAKNGCDQCTAAERGIRLACREFFGGTDQSTPCHEDNLMLIYSCGGELLGNCLYVGTPSYTDVDMDTNIELIQLGSAGKKKLALPIFAQYERLPELDVGDETFDIIRNWINACVKRNVLPGTKGLLPFGHSRCDENDFKPLPRRVLSLTTAKMHLVEPNQGDRGRYACLSYCWGSVEFLQTNISNLEQHKKELPWRNMPQLFRDVVRACRKLSIPYLWIDALCIIQDSDTDWAEQASRMADIYSNSFLTIAATAAKSPHCSLFERIPPPTEFFTIPHDSDYSFTFTARKAMRHPWRGRERGESSYPLLKRAWILQEDCLPPRTLHFLYGEVALSCCAGMMCECSVADTAPNDTWEEASARINCTSPKIYPTKRSPGGRRMSDTIRSWHSIVEMYTSTSLTRGSDKLPALSGLAKAMSRHDTNDMYFSGLWKNSLKYDLLWTSCSSGLSKLEPDRAPSWSWASVDGMVFFRGFSGVNSLKFDCEVVKTPCESSLIDEFGQVSDREIVLKGKLLPGALEYEPSADPEYFDKRRRNPHWSRSSNEAWVKYGGKSFSFNMDHTLSKYGITDGTKLELLCLCDGGLNRYQKRMILGLVLYQKPGDGQCRERVGFWSYDFKETGGVLSWEVIQELSSQEVKIQ